MGRRVDRQSELDEFALERLWDSLGRRVYPDPRFFLDRDRPDLRGDPAALGVEMVLAIRTREEVLAERRQLERLPVRERIDAFVNWCDRLGPPYAEHARRLVADAGAQAPQKKRTR